MKQIIHIHRFQSITSLLFCFCVAAMPALAQGRGGFNSQGMREHHELGFPGTIADAVASFTRYYDLFDKERKGQVSLATLLEAMSGGEAGEVRTLNRYKGWDKDKDGLISRAEMTTGIEASVTAMVEQQLKADADADGALTPAEYLLSIPATGNPNNPAINQANQDKNANGLTSRQQRMFDSADLDKDGKISRAEILGSQARRASNAYLAMAIVAHAHVCDVNQDGQLDLAEFGLMYGLKPGEPLPPQAATRFKGRDGSRASLSFQGLWQMIHHDSKADLDEMDRHINAFEQAPKSAPATSASDLAPAKPEDAAAAFGGFFGVVDKDSDGKVTLAELLDAHNAEESDAKTLSHFKSWDTDRDGFIIQREGEAGVKAYVLDQVEQQLKADGDGNGVLSLSEFALAVPDPNGEKLTGSDITRRQELMFRSADTDKDSRYTRAEAIASMSRRSQYGYIGRRVAYRARAFDLNLDRKYDLNEFALIYGAKPGETIPQAIFDKHNSKSFGAGNHTYYNVMMRLIHTPQNELKEIDLRIAAYEKRHGVPEVKAAIHEKQN